MAINLTTLREQHNIEVMIKSWKEGGDIVYVYSVNELGKPSKYSLENKSLTYREALAKAFNKANEQIQNEKRI